MTAYAGFESLADYLERRRLAQSPPLSRAELSRRIGFRQNYISLVIAGKFLPSRHAAEKIAAVFGDEPRIIKILCGLETEELKPKESLLRQINSLAQSLTESSRRKAVEYLQLLLFTQRR